jgi:transcriptional regulator with XRE-family HTH domain
LRCESGAGLHITRHRINPARLRLELLRRGLDGQTFARHAGVSAATVSHILNGRVANPMTISKVALALARIPPLAGLDSDMLELVRTSRNDASRIE